MPHLILKAFLTVYSIIKCSVDYTSTADWEFFNIKFLGQKLSQYGVVSDNDHRSFVPRKRQKVLEKRQKKVPKNDKKFPKEKFHNRVENWFFSVDLTEEKFKQVFQLFPNKTIKSGKVNKSK